MQLSKQRRQDIINALRRGTVPRESLDAFAVGLENLEPTIVKELTDAGGGRSAFKAVRGEYGCGKTFFARWMADKAKELGFATSEVQISETETPLYRLETVYRRLNERLSTADAMDGAFRNVLDGWFYAVERDVLAEGSIDESDEEALLRETDNLIERRLHSLGESAQTFSIGVRGYRRAQALNDRAAADSIAAWLAGQPNVAAAAKRFAGVKGDIDHYGALTFLQGLLTVLRDSGYRGLLLVLDEVETVQRMRSDVREKSLNALRQLIDEVDAGRFPGLYLVITGTTAFFDGHQGVQRLEPLAQRLHVDFRGDPKFDNPRAPQIRLPAFNLERLQEVGRKVRDIFAEQSRDPKRIREACDNDYVSDFASSVAGKLGGRVGLAPRVYLKKLVTDVLDKVDQFPEFDPRVDYELYLADSELTPEEREAVALKGVNDIELEL